MQKNTRTPLTALVVYDNPRMCWFLARRLKELGFDSIIEAKDGEMAINRLRFATLKGIVVSLIVSDINMPQIRGVEFIKEIRGYPAFKKIPVVLLGNFAEDNAESIGRHIEDIICVLNPINADDFRDKVQEALVKAGTAA